MPDLVLRDVPLETVLFVGDSRIRMFDGLRFADHSRPGIEILTRARWKTFFRASTFFGNGRFDEYMTRLWWELRCVAHDLTGGSSIFTPFVYLQSGGVEQIVGLAPSGPTEHVIVVSCGADFWDIEQELQRYYISFDTPVEGLESLPDYDAPETMDQAAVRAIVRERLRPLFDGLGALRDAGFMRLFLMGCAPPSTEWREGWTPARLRYAVRTVFDRTCEQFCRDSGIGFVSIWESLARNGLRDDRFFADAEHVNVDGATVMLNRLYACPEFTTNDRG